MVIITSNVTSNNTISLQYVMSAARAARPCMHALVAAMTDQSRFHLTCIFVVIKWHCTVQINRLSCILYIMTLSWNKCCMHSSHKQAFYHWKVSVLTRVTSLGVNGLGTCMHELNHTEAYCIIYMCSSMMFNIIHIWQWSVIIINCSDVSISYLSFMIINCYLILFYLSNWNLLVHFTQLHRSYINEHRYPANNIVIMHDGA